MTTPLYEAVATVNEAGREGAVATSDGRLDVELAIPSELGGSGGPGTNPEQLFAAGYAACFESALQGVARRAKQDASDASVTARVGLHRGERASYVLSVQLDVVLPHLDQDTANELVEGAHQRCPYSNATRGNIEVHLQVVDSPPGQ